MIPLLCPHLLQNHLSSTNPSSVFVVIHWCVLVLLELLDWPCVARTSTSDKLRPLPQLESSIPTPSGHP